MRKRIAIVLAALCITVALLSPVSIKASGAEIPSKETFVIVNGEQKQVKVIHVFDDGTCMIRYTDNLRNGYSYNYNIGKNGELVVLSGEDTVFIATMNDEGMLTDLDGNLWFPQD